MDNYNNGPIPPYQNNGGGSGYPPYYTPPVRHPGSGFATAALICGILAILSSFVIPVWVPAVFGGLSIILALLSKGSDKGMLPNAKVGVLTAGLGIALSILITVSSVVMIYTNPKMKEEFHNSLNQTYQYMYGESFDDALKQIEDGLSY